MRGGAWNDGGVILFGDNGSNVMHRVSSAGGIPAAASSLDKTDDNGNRYPYFLPDQKHFLYTAPHPEAPFPLRVGSLDEPGKPGKVVAQVGSNAMFASGQLFYLRDNTLMAQPFDSQRLETTGEPIPIAEHIPTFGQPSRMAGYAVSATGVLVYQSSNNAGQSQLALVDRAGKTLKRIGDPGYTFDLTLSPDGKTLAASLEPGDLWLYDLARELKTRFTFDAGIDREATWMPDGSTIFWRSTRNGAGDIFRKAANGTGNDQVLFAEPGVKQPTSVSPDGKVLLYTGVDPVNPRTRNDIWVLPLEPGQAGGPLKSRPLIQSLFSEGNGQFSPDGAWVAYTSEESGQREVYAIPYPGPGGKRQISTEGGLFPRWRPGGKEIYYLTTQGDLMAAEVAARNGTLEVGKLQRLFSGIPTSRGYPYAPTADGQKFIIVQGSAAESAPPLTLIQNWPALLRRP